MADQFPKSLADRIERDGVWPHMSEIHEGALRGDNACLIVLGHMYFRGDRKLRKDYGEALQWFKKVDLEYDVSGLVAARLGEIFFRGLGTPKNHRIASKYLRKAALRGHGKSKVLFAILQKEGDGTLRKPRSAHTIIRASICNPRLSLMMRFIALMWLWA